VHAAANIPDEAATEEQRSSDGALMRCLEANRQEWMKTSPVNPCSGV
jgi:hypothetical protein